MQSEKNSVVEMLSFGGIQFAASVYMAFLSYYLMAFCTDVALIPAATTAVLLFCFRLFSAADTPALGLLINRTYFREGKYRPYLKWSALPFGISLAGLGLAPEIGIAGRVFYLALMLLICDLSWSAINTASMSMIPYLARDDVNRTKFISFSNGSSILAFLLVGTFMLPLVNFFSGGGGESGSEGALETGVATAKGYALVLALFAVLAVPLIFNAYARLREKGYPSFPNKPAIKDIFLVIGRHRRLMLFLAGFCVYYMADAFKNLTTYYYMTYYMGRPDLLPVVIMAGLITPLAVQPVIPKLLRFANKEAWIVFGLFAAMCCCLSMLAAGLRPYHLIVCVVFYGAFTAIVANLVYAVVAAFTDEIQMSQNISISEILTASVNVSSNIGIAIASGAAAAAMATFGYKAGAAVQAEGVLLAIKTLYILCPATGMALAGYIMQKFRTLGRQ